jgi:hypothetical protein
LLHIISRVLGVSTTLSLAWQHALPAAAIRKTQLPTVTVPGGPLPSGENVLLRLVPFELYADRTLSDGMEAKEPFTKPPASAECVQRIVCPAVALHGALVLLLDW